MVLHEKIANILNEYSLRDRETLTGLVNEGVYKNILELNIDGNTWKGIQNKRRRDKLFVSGVKEALDRSVPPDKRKECEDNHNWAKQAYERLISLEEKTGLEHVCEEWNCDYLWASSPGVSLAPRILAEFLLKIYKTLDPEGNPARRARDEKGIEEFRSRKRPYGEYCSMLYRKEKIREIYDMWGNFLNNWEEIEKQREKRGKEIEREWVEEMIATGISKEEELNLKREANECYPGLFPEII